jgi:hypothetical protein
MGMADHGPVGLLMLDLATYLLMPCGLAFAWYLWTYPTN